MKRFLLSAWVLSLALVMLSACENRVDLAHKQITVEKVRSDLTNREILAPDNTAFVIEEPGSIKLVSLVVTEEEGRATAEVSAKALELSSETGVEGTLKLIYSFAEGRWQLQEVTGETLEWMSAPYAKRLGELVEFPLHFAANTGDIALVKKALKDQADVNAPEKVKQSSALMFASERGFLDIVKLLLANGADVNYHNRSKLTALHVAAYGDHLEIAKHLVEKGADLSAADLKGKTPLAFAASNDALDVTKYLVAQGVDVNAKTEQGRPPIFEAAKSDSLEVAKFLIDNGAEVNLRIQDRNFSPLLSAAYYNSVGMVELLLDSGAETSAQLSGFHRGEKVYSALALAEERGHTQVVEILKARGAQ